MKEEDGMCSSVSAKRSGFLRGLNITTPNENVGTKDDIVRSSRSMTEMERNDKTLQWSYMYVPRNRVDLIKGKLQQRFEVFVHTQVKYSKKKSSGDLRKEEVPTISGLVFVKGDDADITLYLRKEMPGYHLCKDCSTGRTARIPGRQMRTFMAIAKARPDDVRFLLRPYYYFANNNKLLRIVSGEFAGLEGYIVRIDRDRKLVMNIGGMTVAIGGVHKCHFEEVADESDRVRREAMEQAALQPLRDIEFEEVDAEFSKRQMAQKRGLDIEQATVDRFFHPVNSDTDARVQAENVEMLIQRVSSRVQNGEMDDDYALHQLMFLIEEIAFYYAPLANGKQKLFEPLKKAGLAVLRDVDLLLSRQLPESVWLENALAEKEKMMADYGYLFDS